MAHTAIFCNGNFINATDANSCINDLKALFNITVTGYAYGSSGCEGGTCMAQGAAGGSASCAATPANQPPVSPALLGIGVGMIVVGVVRRRRRQS
jgi:hypothetical protein